MADAPEVVDEEVWRVYRSMTADQLHLMRLAFQLDLDAATSADSRAFCLARIRLITAVLFERGARD